MDLDVSDDPELSRYEAYAAGELAGYAAYKLAENQVIVFTHTVVEPAHEGQGVGGTLIRSAMDDVRSRQLTVVARCAFVRAWLDRHPEYADLERPPQPQ